MPAAGYVWLNVAPVTLKSRVPSPHSTTTWEPAGVELSVKLAAQVSAVTVRFGQPAPPRPPGTGAAAPAACSVTFLLAVPAFPPPSITVRVINLVPALAYAQDAVGRVGEGCVSVPPAPQAHT